MLTSELESLERLETVDEIGRCVDRLEALLPRREDSRVLLDFLEDDLRQGFEAVEEVQDHFRQILETLESQRLSAAALVEAGEDFRILDRLEYLHVVVGQLRKRLSQAAGKLRGGPPPAP